MKKYYFSIVSILLLLLSLFGFSDNLFTDVTQKSNSDLNRIHPISYLGFIWMYLVQAIAEVV